MQNTADGSSASISSHVAARVSRVTYCARSTRRPRHPKQPPSHMISSRSPVLTLQDGLAPPRGTFFAELRSLGARAWRSRGLKSGTKRGRAGKGMQGGGAQRGPGNKSESGVGAARGTTQPCSRAFPSAPHLYCGTRRNAPAMGVGEALGMGPAGAWPRSRPREARIWAVFRRAPARPSACVRPTPSLVVARD